MSDDRLLEQLHRSVAEIHHSTIDLVLALLDGDAAGPSAIRSAAMSLPQREQREALGKIARVWTECPSVSCSTLRGMLVALRFARLREAKAEICWSGPVGTLQGFRSTPEAFRELMAQARYSVLGFTYAVGEVNQLRESVEDALVRGVEVDLVVEDFNVFEQSSWRSKLTAFGPTVLRSAALYSWPTSKRRSHEGRVFGSMHVKCLVADHKRLLLTSANWSGAAMQDNMEMGLLVSDPPLASAVARHFEDLVSSGTLVRISL